LKASYKLLKTYKNDSNNKKRINENKVTIKQYKTLDAYSVHI